MTELTTRERRPDFGTMAFPLLDLLPSIGTCNKKERCISPEKKKIFNKLFIFKTMCLLLYNIKNDMGMGKWWSKKEDSQKWHN